MQWSKRPISWVIDDTIYYSIVFTWHLAEVYRELSQRNFFWSKAVVGGPAVKMCPDYFEKLSWVREQGNIDIDVLSLHNPQANRTSIGCPRKCSFCQVKKIEPKFATLTEDRWKKDDKTLFVDNNFLATSEAHQEEVLAWCRTQQTLVDFNQGLDCRFFGDSQAKLFAAIPNKIIRFSLDSISEMQDWENAVETALKAGIHKKDIRSYCLIGFDGDPAEAWARCNYIEKHGVKCLPMFYRPPECNDMAEITKEQKSMGWNKTERARILGFFYRHRGIRL